MLNPGAVYRKTENILEQIIDGETIIIPVVAGVVDLGGALFSLNEAAKDIWQRIDGQKSISEIAVELGDIYDIDNGTLGRDIDELLRNLLEKRIIQEVNQAS